MYGGGSERCCVGAQDIDAAYLFQDIGDIDDDLSSLLVPDLDFSGLNDMYTPSVKKPPPVQTGVNMQALPSTVKTQNCTCCSGCIAFGFDCCSYLLRGCSRDFMSVSPQEKVPADACADKGPAVMCRGLYCGRDQ